MFWDNCGDGALLPTEAACKGTKLYPAKASEVQPEQEQLTSTGLDSEMLSRKQFRIARECMLSEHTCPYLTGGEIRTCLPHSFL